MFVFVIIIIILILLYMINSIYIESYVNSAIYPTRLFGMTKYVLLNKFNRVESASISPPLPKTGETRCDKVVCPPWVPSDAVCYKCK